MTPSTVLLIEDEPIIRLGTVAMLEDAGYSVLEAADASEALTLLSDHSEIRLIITDVQMPGPIDGLMLVEIVQQDYPAIRSLVTSGKAGWSEARKCGANGYLAKPYSAASMETALQELLVA